jgi:hypothetical protein
MQGAIQSVLAATICSFVGFAASAQETARPAAPKTRPINVELNKLEPAGNACRGYFVIANTASEPLKELRLDVFLFDKSGIVLRRVGLTFADIRADRSKVVLFDIPETACSDIGRFVVNDVLACTSASGSPLPGCAAMVATSTRTGTEFSY